MRRAVLAAACCLLVAGCGYEGTHQPTAAAIEGPLPQQKKLPPGNAAAGKAVFLRSGCGGCHTYGPAGSKGQTGPDLDKLPQYAKQANQGPLEQFVETSIVNPGAYVQPGYQNIMPASIGANLPTKQLADLVAFLTKNKK